MEQKINHIYAADYIRGFASLLVAVFHLGGKTLPLLKYGWLGVQLFFVLSGFIICWSMPASYMIKDFGTFIWKRIVRIEPPYIISILLTIIVGYLLVKNYQLNLLNLLMHFGYLNSFFNQPYLNPVYWTLGIEFQFYIFIGIFYPLLMNRWGAIYLIILLIISLLLSTNGTLLSNHFSLFALGIMAFRLKTSRSSTLEFSVAISVILAVAFYKISMLEIITGIIATIILLIPLKANTYISFLAKISFSLYLTHDIIGSNLVIFLGSLFKSKTIWSKAFAFSVGLVVAVAFAYLFYLLVEKTCLKISKKISYHASSDLTNISSPI